MFDNYVPELEKDQEPEPYRTNHCSLPSFKFMGLDEAYLR